MTGNPAHKRFLLLVMIILIIPGFISAATFELNASLRKAYELVHLLRFNEATEIIWKEKSRNPDNVAIAYVESQMDFLRAFISEEEVDFIRLKRNLSQRIELTEKIENDTPWKRLMKAEALMHIAIVKLKWREYLTAAYQFRKAYRLLEENKRKFPGFIPNLKGLGFFHTVIGAVPENYKWLSNIAGMHGTIRQGAAELTLLYLKTGKDSSLSFLHNESMFIKTFVLAHFEKNNEGALVLAGKIKDDSLDDGPLEKFIIANTYIINGKNDSALHILSQPVKSGTYPLHYLNYLRGMVRLNKLDYTAANDFNAFITGFRGNSFVKSAWQKIAWISFLNHDIANYRKNISKALTAGNDFTDEDRQALHEAESNETPNYYLLRSRLLFDGGYYHEALAELAGKPQKEFPVMKDQLEFTYRLARIYDKTGEWRKAITYYEITYKNGNSRPYYFAANSALNVAGIYEEQGEKEKAEEWLRKCLALRGHEYQNSIDQKAEAAMNRLGKETAETKNKKN